MTLLELCDELKVVLIIKRHLIKTTKDELKYSVYLQCTTLQTSCNLPSYAPVERAYVAHKDANKALHLLCEKISYKYVMSFYKSFEVGEVKKGNLSILGV